MMRRAPAVAAVWLAFAPSARADNVSREVDELVAWLTGTFDSKEQSAMGGEAPAVRMVTVPVPKSLLAFGAPVLYREEAAAERPDRPLQQRFLRVEEDAAGTILMRVFELKVPAAAAGKWRDARDLGLFGKNDVRERDGCLVTLRRVGDRYEGGTTGTRCVSSIRGAAYATSETKIWKDRIEAWDRGFDADRKQVWGPVKAPLRFVKRSTAVPGDAVPGEGLVPALPAAGAAPAPPVLPQPAKVDAEDPPEGTRRGDVSLTGIGRSKVISPEELRTNPAAGPVHVAREETRFRGVPLAALLDARGIPSDGTAARRVLASAVVVAIGADDSVSAFSAEEIFLSKDSFFLVFERDGRSLEADGPLMLLDLKSPSRNVKRLRSLEWRVLGAPPPGSTAP